MRRRPAATLGAMKRRLGGVLVLVLAFGAGGGLPSLLACGGPERPRHAVLVVLDTLRADRLSLYGNPRRASPALDRLGTDGVWFESAVSSAPWTLPGMIGLLSSDYPTRAGWSPLRSMARVLQQAGWTTAAFTEGGFVSASFGFHVGFDHFDEHSGLRPLFRPGKKKVRVLPEEKRPPPDPNRGIERTFRRATEWLEEWAAQDSVPPFFLLVHTYEPHTPYERRLFAEGLDSGRWGPTYGTRDAMLVKARSPALDPAEIEYVRALYDGGVATADRYVGELRETLERLGIAGETLLVVTSDHGEDLGDRDPPWPGSHGHHVYDEQALIPLIVYDPTQRYAARRVPWQVRILDVMPTILERLGVPAPGDRPGRSLVPLMTGEEQGHRTAWTLVGEIRTTLQEFERRRAVRTGRYKLIVSEPEEVELYDLAEDPGERVNLAERAPELARELRARLDEVKPREDSGFELPEEELRERLRALGYVE